MSKRAAMPGTKLPYLTDRAFEEEASLLLAEYSRQHGEVAAPPVPIDEIVELHLELELEFHDMRRLFGVDDVHGALWINQRRVGIDQRLEPAAHPAMLGRYRFTLAHEAGHWQLHRHLFQRAANQLQLLPEGVDRPEYICRSGDSEPIEYQANRFASCVLMPRELVKRCWEAWRGNLDPIYLVDLRTQQHQVENAIDNMLLEHAARPLATMFEVSPEAMRIRLEGMGLLARKKEQLLF